MPQQQPQLPAVVAVAASEGGLTALGVLLAGLPADFPAAVVVVQHIGTQRSLLADILGQRTPLRVKQTEEGDALQRATVFLAPPDHHLLVNPDGTLSLSRSPKVKHARPSAEPLFASVASSFKDRAIGVVLTGGDCDGSEGVRAIKQAGGTVVAQDETSCQNPSVPRAAVATGCVYFVLPLADIAAALVGLVEK
jgi:two-component system chemotaxis response regulator CheB